MHIAPALLEADHNYVSSDLNGQTIVLGPNVRLVLPNGLSGAENLLFNYTDYINPGLTVYAGGTSASISGNQYINPCGFAGSLIVYCAPTVTSFTLNGNGQFTGVLVAPNADLAMPARGSLRPSGGQDNPESDHTECYRGVEGKPKGRPAL